MWKGGGFALHTCDGGSPLSRVRRAAACCAARVKAELACGAELGADAARSGHREGQGALNWSQGRYSGSKGTWGGLPRHEPKPTSSVSLLQGPSRAGLGPRDSRSIRIRGSGSDQGGMAGPWACWRVRERALDWFKFCQGSDRPLCTNLCVYVHVNLLLVQRWREALMIV